MFQLTLRLGGVEVEQHADAARDAVGDRDLRGAEQGNVAPAEQARGSRGILGCEIRGRGEDRALDILGLEAVRILERAQQLGGSVQDRLAGVCRGSGGAAQSERKSTRLNSSHTVTSYAVLCSKKKIGLAAVVIVSLTHAEFHP